MGWPDSWAAGGGLPAKPWARPTPLFCSVKPGSLGGLVVGGSAAAIPPDSLLCLKSELCPPAHSCCWLGSWAPGSGGLSLPAELVPAVSLGERGTHFCNRIFIPHQGFVPLAVETLGTGTHGSPVSLTPVLFLWLCLSPSLSLFTSLFRGPPFLSHSLSAAHDKNGI